jgi:hypothetical protein
MTGNSLLISRLGATSSEGHPAAFVDASGLKNISSSGNLGMTEASIWRISGEGPSHA